MFAFFIIQIDHLLYILPVPYFPSTLLDQPSQPLTTVRIVPRLFHFLDFFVREATQYFGPGRAKHDTLVDLIFYASG